MPAANVKTICRRFACTLRDFVAYNDQQAYIHTSPLSVWGRKCGDLGVPVEVEPWRPGGHYFGYFPSFHVLFHFQYQCTSTAAMGTTLFGTILFPSRSRWIVFHANKPSRMSMQTWKMRSEMGVTWACKANACLLNGKMLVSVRSSAH